MFGEIVQNIDTSVLPKNNWTIYRLFAGRRLSGRWTIVVVLPDGVNNSLRFTQILARTQIVI